MNEEEKMLNIEFVPWYHAGSDLVRCTGCAALVVSHDAEIHLAWHQAVWDYTAGTNEALRMLAAQGRDLGTATVDVVKALAARL